MQLQSVSNRARQFATQSLSISLTRALYLALWGTVSSPIHDAPIFACALPPYYLSIRIDRKIVSIVRAPSPHDCTPKAPTTPMLRSSNRDACEQKYIKKVKDSIKGRQATPLVGNWSPRKGSLDCKPNRFSRFAGRGRLVVQSKSASPCQPGAGRKIALLLVLG